MIAAAEAIYGSLLDACTGCVLLAQYFDGLSIPPQVADGLKAQFLSTYGRTGPISELLSEVTLFDFDKLGVEGFPIKTSWQQGQDFPDQDKTVKILHVIKDLVPMWELEPSIPSDAVFVISQ